MNNSGQVADLACDPESVQQGFIVTTDPNPTTLNPTRVRDAVAEISNSHLMGTRNFIPPTTQFEHLSGKVQEFSLLGPYKVIQWLGESMHHFWARFLLDKDRAEGHGEQEMINAFRHNCHGECILNALARRRIQTFTELSSLVLKYSALERTWQIQQMCMELRHINQTRGI